MTTCRIYLTTFFAFVFSLGLSGCSTAYVQSKSVIDASDYPAAIERAKKDKRSFILHSGMNVYTITAVQLDHAKQNIHVQLNKLDSLHIVRVAGPNNNQQRPAKNSSAPGEIHVYMKDSTSYLLEEPYTLSLDKVAKIDLVGKG